MATFSLEVVGHNDEVPFESGAKERSLHRFINYLRGCLGGARGGAVTLNARNTEVAASGTLTLTTCLADTVVEVNGVPFTAIASGVPVLGNGEFVISGADSADATSLAAAINASTNTRIADIVTASSTGASGVVTVTSDRKGSLGNGMTLATKGVVAKATVTPTSAVATDTVTINGTALTCKQQRATGTLTASTAIAGNTFSIRGNTFTGQASAATRGTLTFDVGSSDTACARSICHQINSYPALAGVVTATHAAGVVTVRAVDAGTAGNSISLTGTAVTLAASAATLEGGIAVANNEWDSTGTDYQVAADLARCINASSTAAISSYVRALAHVAPTVACSAVDAGDTVTIYVNGSSYVFTAVAGAVIAGTLYFSKDTGNTETGASLSAQINAYSALSGVVSSSASAGTVTIKPMTDAAAKTLLIFGDDTTDVGVVTAAKGAVNVYSKLPGTAGNAITIATADGTRLPIAGSLARLGSGTAAGVEGVAASGTLTLTSWANGETVAINGVTITAHTNTQANNQVDISGDDTADAANLALAINNSTSAGLKEVFATSSSNVVTVTARRGGLAGNAITLSSGQGTVVANVARLASGAVPTSVVVSGERLGSGSESLMQFTF